MVALGRFGSDGVGVLEEGRRPTDKIRLLQVSALDKLAGKSPCTPINAGS